MPLYEYHCPTCHFEFELLRNGNENVSEASCLKCQGKATRKISTFGFAISGGSPTETIDKTIGRDSEKKWQRYTDMQSERRKNQELKPVESPKTSDGKYMPVMSLGTEKERKLRKEYSDSLRSHKEKLKEKGVVA